eukprot:NODE_9_length_47730_cov_0.323718.p1 type:complete len:3222 gc:universal NODE_9_length_47730_cov_0.323718:5948-15613(+)
MEQLVEQLSNLQYSNPVVGYINKLKNISTDEIRGEVKQGLLDEEWIRKELMSEVDCYLTLDKKLLAYSKILKNSQLIKSSLNDKEMEKMCLGKELTAKHGITIIQLLVPYINYIDQFRDQSPLLISHYYKVLSQGWTTSRFFCKDDIFTGLILNLRDSLMPKLREISSSIYQNPKDGLFVVDSCIEAFRAYKIEYFKNREEIENNGKIVRWEFDQTKLFDITNYISDVLSDLKHILTVLYKIQSSLDDNMKSHTGEGLSIDELLKKSFKIVSAFEQLSLDIWDKKNKNSWKTMIRRFDDNLVHIEEMICQFITNCLRKSSVSFINLQILQCCSKPGTLDSVVQLADASLKVLVTNFYDEIKAAKAKFDTISKSPSKSDGTFDKVYQLKQEYNTYKKVMVELRKNRVIDSIEGKALFDSYINFSIVIKHLHDTWCTTFFDNTISRFNSCLSWNVLIEKDNKIVVNFPFEMYPNLKEIKLFEAYITDLSVNIKIIAPQLYQCSQKYQRLYRTVFKLNAIRESVEFTEEWLISDHVKQLETVLNTGILRMTWCSLAIDKYCESLEKEILNMNSKMQQAHKTLNMMNKKIHGLKKIGIQLINEFRFTDSQDIQLKLRSTGRRLTDSIIQVQQTVSSILTNLPKVFHKDLKDPLFGQLCLETEKLLYFTCEGVCDAMMVVLTRKFKVEKSMLAEILISSKGILYTNPNSAQLFKILMQFPNWLANPMDRVYRWENGSCKYVNKEMGKIYNFKNSLIISKVYIKSSNKYQKNCADLMKSINIDIESLNKYQMIWKCDLDDLRQLEMNNADSCIFYANITNYLFSLQNELADYLIDQDFRFLKYGFAKFLLFTKDMLIKSLTDIGSLFLSRAISEIKDGFLKIESLGDAEFGSGDICSDFDNYFKLKQQIDTEKHLSVLIYHFDVLISLCRPLFNTSNVELHMSNFQSLLSVKSLKSDQFAPIQNLFDLLKSKLEKEFHKIINYGDAVLQKFTALLVATSNPITASKVYVQFSKEFSVLLDKANELSDLGTKTNLNLMLKWNSSNCSVFIHDDLEEFLTRFSEYYEATLLLTSNGISVLVVQKCNELINKCSGLMVNKPFSFLTTSLNQLKTLLEYLSLINSLMSHNLELRHFTKISKTVHVAEIQKLDFIAVMKIDFNVLQDAITKEKEWFSKELELERKYMKLLRQVSHMFISKVPTSLFKLMITNIADMKIKYESIIIELALLLSLDHSEFIRMEIINSNNELVNVVDCLSSIDDIQTEIESVYTIIQNLLKNNTILEKIKLLKLRYYEIIDPLFEYESVYQLMSDEENDLVRLKQEVFTLKRYVFTELDQFRNTFPRFWILSNDELIKILSFSFKKEWFNTFKRIFNGVDKFTFTKDAQNVFITSLGNTENETLALPIDIGLNYSDLKCFASLLTSMQIGIRNQIFEAINCILNGDLDALIAITSSAITVALRYCASKGHMKSLSEDIVKQLQISNKWKSKKLEKIFIDLSNAKELSHIFGVEINNNLICTTFNGMRFEHGLEFKACSRIFCHTPITIRTFSNFYVDRISKKWTYALGLSGSGKTESIQEFSDFCGYFCYEVNCGDVLGSESLKNILTGSEFKKASYWVNLSEVNRLSSKVLLQLSESILVLNGNTFSNVFVSLNPYSQSRNIIPESVKFQFHQIILEKPPVKEIFVKMLTSPIFIKKDKKFAESLLQSACYLDCFHTRDTYPGMFLKLLQMYIDNPNQIMPSMKSFVHPDKSSFVYKNETDLISKSESIIQFLERFHSLVLVGSFDDSFVSTIKDVENHYLQQGNVKTQHVNPNMYSSFENFGSCDDFNVFTSGVITSCLEEGCSYQGTYLLVLDAELFSEWSENLNSVLDDNRSFFYPDGKKLEISLNVKIIFCTCSLKNVSPSVTRRSTVVFVDLEIQDCDFWIVHYDNLKQEHLFYDPDVSINCIVNYYTKIKHLNELYGKYYAFWAFSKFKTFDACSSWFKEDLNVALLGIQELMNCNIIFDPNSTYNKSDDNVLKTLPDTSCHSIWTSIKSYLISVSKDNWQTQKVSGQLVVLADVDQSLNISTFSFLRFYMKHHSIWVNNDGEWTNKNVSRLLIKATISNLDVNDPELRRLLRSVLFLKLQTFPVPMSNKYYHGSGTLDINYEAYSTFEQFITEQSDLVYIDVVSEREVICKNAKTFYNLLTRDRVPNLYLNVKECILYGKSLEDLVPLQCLFKNCSDYLKFIELKVDVRSHISFMSDKIDVDSIKLDEHSSNLKFIKPIFVLIFNFKTLGFTRNQKFLTQMLSKLDGCLLNLKERSTWLHGIQQQAFIESQNLTGLRIDVGQKTKDIDDKKKLASLKEKEINESRLKIESEKEFLDIGLKQSYPILESAKKALSNISASDITELRSFSKPPMDVQKVVECICILLKKEDLSWKSSKSMMSNTEFRSNLMSLDCDGLTNGQVHHIDKILKSSDLNIEKMKKTSSAGCGLLDYVFNILQYHSIVTEMKPKMKQLQVFDNQLSDLINSKEQVLLEIGELEMDILKLKQHLNALEKSLVVVDKNIVIWKELDLKFTKIEGLLVSDISSNTKLLDGVNKSINALDITCFEDALSLLDLSENGIKDMSEIGLPFIYNGLQLNEDLGKFVYWMECPHSYIIEDPYLRCFSVLHLVPNSIVVNVLDSSLKLKLKFSLDNNKHLILVSPNISCIPQDVLQINQKITIYCSKIDISIQNYAMISFKTTDFVTKSNDEWKLQFQSHLAVKEKLKQDSTSLLNTLNAFQSTNETAQVDELLFAMSEYQSITMLHEQQQSKLLSLEFTRLNLEENDALKRYHSQLPRLYCMSAHLLTLEFYKLPVEALLKSSLLPVDQLGFYTNQNINIYSTFKHLLSCGTLFIFSNGDSTYQFVKEIYPDIKRTSMKSFGSDLAIYYNILNLSEMELVQFYFKLLEEKPKNVVIDVPISELPQCSPIMHELLKLGYKISSLVALDLNKVISKNMEISLTMERKKEFILFHSIVCYLIELKLILLYPQYWIDNLISIVEDSKCELKKSLNLFYFNNLRHQNEKICCSRILDYVVCKSKEMDQEELIDHICNLFQESDRFQFKETELQLSPPCISEFSKLQLLEDLTMDQRRFWVQATEIQVTFLTIPSNLVYFFDKELLYMDGIPVLNLSKSKNANSIAVHGLRIKNAYLTENGLVYAQSRLGQSGHVWKCNRFEYLVPLFKNNVLYLYFNCTLNDELLNIKIARVDIE